MIMRIRNRNANKQKRGFTLTEIAIVLGIVGLILGAIWVAAAAVYNNLRVSRATTELLTIAQNVRAMYATSPTVDPNADMTTFAGQSGNAATYVSANVFPSDMISSATTGSGTAAVTNPIVLSPWGGGVLVQSAYANNPNDSFAVEFAGVPKAACIAMITSNTGGGRDSGLFNVQAQTGSTVITYQATQANTTSGLAPGSAGLSATFGTTGCVGATNTVAFAFKLKG